MTSQQLRAITAIQQWKLRDNCHNEVKRFRLSEIGKKVLVQVCVGLTGDEGTAAAILCRERGAFLVGPRGGIQALDSHAGTPKTKLSKYPVIYGWRS